MVGFVYLLILVLCIPTVKTLTDDASDDNLIGNMVNTQYANSAIGKMRMGMGSVHCYAVLVLLFCSCSSCNFLLGYFSICIYFSLLFQTLF